MMATTLVFKSPAELEEAGFIAEPIRTLEGTPLNLYWRRMLEKWTKRLPGLHTPRNQDGSGGTPPKEHQLRHASIALCRKHNFFAYSMGVGKTAQSILCLLGWFGEELLAGRLRPGTIHIVGPRHILNQVWMRELERMNLVQYAEVIECESQLLNSKAPIFVYSYDLAKLQSDKGRAMKKLGQGIRLNANAKPYFVGYPLAKVIAKHRPPSLLIADEVHKLRGVSERTRCMQIVRRKAKRVIGLTGTPMDGWVEHAAVILGFIYGEESKAFPYTAEHFAKKFTKTKVVTTDIATGQETVGKERPVPGINHMQIPSFIRTTSHLMHRLNLTDPEVKANVVYPPTRIKEILIKMDEEQSAFYSAIHQQNTKQVEEELGSGQSAKTLRINILALMNELRLASKAPWALGYKGESTQLVKTVIDIVKAHAAEGRKGLIGTTFIQESRLIHEALAAAGLKGVRIYADDSEAAKKSLSTEAREELIEQFQEDPDCLYLISNKELVAEGLNLAETASYTISCSHGWRSNIESQWVSRVVRPGQIWPWVDCYTLLNEGTIDIYINEMVLAKIAASAGIIDLDFSYGEDTASAQIDPVQLASLLARGNP